MEDDKHHPLPGDFDPLLIGILGCFAGVFMVAAYHFVTTRCTSPAADSDNDREANRPELWSSTSNSSRLPTYRHPGQGKQDGTCAVCLSEYGDGEMIRVLPECLHSFHAPCIDMWLYSHSSCPLCRANTRLLPLPLPRRRFLPSEGRSSEARFQRDSPPATPPEGDETSTRHVTVYMPSLDEDTTPVSAASATVQVGDSPGPLGISTSHSLPTPLPGPNTYVVMPHSPI